MKLFNASSLGVLGVFAAGVLLAQPPAGLRAFGPFGEGAGLPVLLHGTVTGAPFSAVETTQTQRTLANGSQLQHQQQSNIYRDPQGRVRIDTTVTPPASASGASTPRTMGTIYDPVAGFIYRLNPAKMTAVKSPIPQPHTGGTPPAHTPPAGVQVQTQNLGTSTVNGVTATGTQVTTTIAAGAIGNSAAIQVVRVTWVSTALQVPVQITVSDPREGNRTTNVTNIVQASPDESLFQVPSGYNVTTAGRGSNRFGRGRR